MVNLLRCKIVEIFGIYIFESISKVVNGVIDSSYLAGKVFFNVHIVIYVITILCMCHFVNIVR